MARGSISVQVSSEFRREDGDGSLCHCCGEQAWLTQFALWLIVGSSETRFGEYLVCSSCYELSNNK